MDKVNTNNIQYEWDENKNQSNIMKHGVSFEEATTVFNDDNTLYIYDSKHSQYEERFIALGMSDMMRILFVCHCEKQDDVIRIISARKANAAEVEVYETRFV